MPSTRLVALASSLAVILAGCLTKQVAVLMPCSGIKHDTNANGR